MRKPHRTIARTEHARRSAPLVVAIFVYLPNLDDYYVSDDFDHPYLDGYSWERLVAHLTEPADPGEFFRPVARLSMALDHLLWGRTPELSHVVNVLLLGATAMIVGALARRLTRRSIAGLLAGVLFAAHPIHPEAVSFLGGRFDVLAALFGTASILAHVEWAERGATRWAAASVVLFVLAILSKESALVVPFVLAAYELTCAPRRRMLRVVPTALALALYATHRVAVIGTLGGYGAAGGQNAHLPPIDATWLAEFVQFIGYGLITPVNHQALGAVALPLVVALATSFTTLGALALRPPRDQLRPAVFAVVFALLAALPASPLFALDGLVERLEGARFLYFSSAGTSILVAVLLARIRPIALRGSLTGLQIVLYAALTLCHALPWSHASTLARRSIETILDRCRDLPGPTPTVLVFDAPDNYQGAYVWRNGLGAAIRKLHPQRPAGAFVRAALEPDFFEPEGFDLRDHAGRSDVCMLRWDDAAEALVDRSAALRATTPPSSDVTPPRGSGERWWDGWETFNVAILPSGATEWVLEATSGDPHVIAPPAPLAVREIEIEMSVEPRDDVAAPLGEVFWAVDEVPFDPGLHLRLFDVIPDGQPHTYRIRVPLTDPAELEARSIRIRVDPTIFPARIAIHRIELSTYQSE